MRNSDWPVIPLKQVVDPLRAITYGIVQPGPRQKEGVPIIRGKDYSSGRVVDADLYRVLPEIADKYRRSVVRGDDILLSIVGYLGLVAMVPKHLEGANITQTTARVAIAPPNEPTFFFQYFQSVLFKKEIDRFTKGSAQAGLNLRDIERMLVSLPPVPEQRRIAAILSSVDDAIEATQAIIDQLQVVKKAMMAELLTRGLPGRHTRFKQTEIGEVPENWEVLAVDTLIEPATTITYGIVQAGPHVADGVPYIRTGDVKPSGIVEIDRLGRTAREIAAKFERSKVRTGDLVICIRASVGAVASVPPALDGANLTQGTARISPGPRINGTYLLWALRSQGVQDWIDLQCKGSTFREITLGCLRQTPIPVPDRGEQQAIAGSLDTVEGRFRTEEHAQEGLRALKSALMSVLLTGELRVTPDKAAT